MSFESDRMLSGVGAILVALGSFLPFLSLLGIILVLIGLRGLSRNYGNWAIFRNALYGFVFSIIGIIVYILLFLSFFGIFTIVKTVGPGFQQSEPRVFGFAIILLFLTGLLIFYLLHAIFYKRSFDILGDLTGIGVFHTSGLLLLIGSILTIILIGFILIFVAWLLAAVGFFSMRTSHSET